MAATAVGSMEIVLAANMAQFVKGMGDAAKVIADTQKKGETFGSQMGAAITKVGSAAMALKLAIGGAAAAFIGGKLLGGLSQASELVDDLGKASKRLGVGIQELSALRFAAGEAGVEFETLAKAVGKFQKNIGAAVGSGAGSIFVGSAQVGLRDVNGQIRAMPVLLADVARAIERVGNEAERADIAEGLFGREGGDRFLTLLNEGSSFMANLAEQTDRARRLGVLFTDEQVAKLTAYNDAVGRIGEAFLGLRVHIMTAVAPALTELADKVANLVGSTPKIISALTGGSLDEAGRSQLAAGVANLSNKLLSTFRTVGTSTGAVFAVGFHDGLIASLGVIGSAIKTIAREIIIQLSSSLANMGDRLASWFGADAGGDPVALWLRDSTQRWAELVHDGVAELGDQAKQDVDAMVNDAFAAENFANSAAAKALKRAVHDIGDQLHGVAEAAGGLADFADGLNRTGDSADAASSGIRNVGAAASQLLEVSREASRQGFFDGMLKGLAQLTREAENIAAVGEKVMLDIGQGISGGMADALVDATADVRNFGKETLSTMESVGKGVLKAVIQFMLLRAITSSINYFGGQIDPANFGGRAPTAYDVGPIRPNGNFAMGGVFQSGRLLRFASGAVVTRPTLFPMANGMGLMGEAGHEAIMPLQQIGGRLGVNAAGAGTTVQIIDQRQTGERPQVSETRGPDGRRMITVLVRDEVSRMIGDGTFDKAMAGNYGLKRRATAR